MEKSSLMEFADKSMQLDSSHRIDHVIRVRDYCLLLAAHYPECNLAVLEESAILHDIGRDIEVGTGLDHAEEGAKLARAILRGRGSPPSHVEHVYNNILTHRSRGDRSPRSIEGKILHDADKLDLLGAVGIARMFIACGLYRQEMYREIDLDEYKRENITSGGKIVDSKKHAPNLEYYLKVVNICDKMFLPEAITIAREKLAFMEDFFLQLESELNCVCDGDQKSPF